MLHFILYFFDIYYHKMAAKYEIFYDVHVLNHACLLWYRLFKYT